MNEALISVFAMAYCICNVVVIGTLQCNFEHEPGLSDTKSLWIQFKNSTVLGLIASVVCFPAHILHAALVISKEKRHKLGRWVYAKLSYRPFKNC